MKAVGCTRFGLFAAGETSATNNPELITVFPCLLF
jgi:hypothetical protein